MESPEVFIHEEDGRAAEGCGTSLAARPFLSNDRGGILNQLQRVKGVIRELVADGYTA